MQDDLSKTLRDIAGLKEGKPMTNHNRDLTPELLEACKTLEVLLIESQNITKLVEQQKEISIIAELLGNLTDVVDTLLKRIEKLEAK